MFASLGGPHASTETQPVLSVTWQWVCECSAASVVSDHLRPHGLYPARLLCPRNSPVKNTGVGCHALLQGIFLTQGLNQRLLRCSQMLYPVSHLGSPDLASRG